MCTYNNGKIYKLYNTITDDIYIGATTRLLCERMREHMRACNDIKKQQIKLYKCFKEYGVEHFKIELLENYNCNSKDELTAKEGHYIRELKPTLNSCIAGRTLAQYYTDNKERYIERAKIYYDANKNRLCAQGRGFYQNNKDTVAEQRRIYYINNKDKKQEQSKNYNISNKEHIKAQRKNYYEDNKNTFKAYYQNNKERKQQENTNTI